MCQADAEEGMRETRRVFCSAGGLLGGEGGGMHVKDDRPQKANERNKETNKVSKTSSVAADSFQCALRG